MTYKQALTEERDVKKLSGIAEAAISPYTIVTFGSANGVVNAVNANSVPIGVSGDASENNKSTYAAGDPIVIKYDGVVYVKLAGTVERGALLCASTGGAAIALTASGWALGIAMGAGVAGDVIPVLLRQHFKAA